MSLHENRLFSNYLGRTVSVTVILPEAKNEQKELPKYEPNTKFPVIWMLHGLGDDDSVWLRRAGAERLANDYGVAMVMPNADRSFYTDTAYGDPFWSFITKELPERLQFIFPLSAKREDNFVLGYSMGGYGALRWALTSPTQFAAVAALSPVIDLPKFVKSMDDGTLDYPAKLNSTAIWGSQDLENSDLNIGWLLDHPQAGSENLKVLTTAGGQEDFLYEDNLAYRPKLEQTFGQNYTWSDGTGGHNWDFWTPKLTEVMDWLPIKH